MDIQFSLTKLNASLVVIIDGEVASAKQMATVAEFLNTDTSVQSVLKKLDKDKADK